jgi:DNA polymerase IV
MERSILHLDLVDFPVEVERMADPSLRGRPVLIAFPGGRSRIYWASADARAWKVDRGMFVSDAARKCREARVVPPNERLYKKVRDNVLQIVGRYSPVIEPTEVGRTFVDLSGTHRLFGPMRDTAQRIRREIREEIGLYSHLGLSINKSTSKVASDLSDRGLVDVFPGSEETFLAPQPARFLPGTEDIDPALLEDLNILRISQFARMSADQLGLVFGKVGPLLHMRARGFDPRPVCPQSRKPCVAEDIELAPDTNNREEMQAILYRLMEQCSFRLRAAGQAAGSVDLHIGYSDNILVAGKARIPPPTSLDRLLFRSVRDVFARILHRRVRVNYLSLSFGDLTVPQRQIALFRQDDFQEKETSLLGALDDIRKRFGRSAVHRGALP